MTVTPQAQKQAERLGIKGVFSAAKAAKEQPKKLYQTALVSAYFGGLRRQHGICEIILKDDIVYLFRQETLFQVYALPELLKKKVAAKSNYVTKAEREKADRQKKIIILRSKAKKTQ